MGEKDLSLLEVLRKVHAQQTEMLKNGKRSVENRIVSISQPHVRPMVRGKAGAKTEFGAKTGVISRKKTSDFPLRRWDAPEKTPRKT